MKVKLPERRAVSGPGRQDGGAPAAAPLKTRGGKTARRVLRRIGYIAACCCCVGVMLASVAAVVFASYLARLSGTDADMPDLYVLKMAENSIVYAADPAGGDWTEYAVFTGENDRVWTPLEQFPQTLRDAVVSVEDRNFWNQRFGINPGRILGAAVNELTGHRLYGSRQGASTLEQQLIENLTGDSAQSISGKFKEISRAIVMAGRYSKDMILEAYLNIAPLTGTLSGMQAGAQQYFGKDASQLTLAESATLASIPRSPVAYSPYSNPEKLLERRNWVLGLMLDQKRISQADYDAAAAAPLGVRSREEAAAASPRGKVNSYFTDAVFERLADDIMEKENCGRAAAVTRIRTGGLRIFSTVDLRLQRMLEAFMENDGEDGYFPALWRQEEADTGIPFDSADAVSYGDDGLPLNAQGEPVFRPDDTPVYEQDGTTLLRGSSAQPNADGVHTLVFYRNIRTQAAVATMDYEGHVLALVGGVGEKRYDLSLNRAADVPRQIGSTMKPLAAYALGIENGVINYSSLIADAPLYTQQDHRMLNTEYCRKLGLSLDPGDPANQARDDVWRAWPTNYNGPGTGRPVVVADALAQSLNTVPVQIGDMLGKRRLFDFAYGSLGLTHLDPERDNDLGPLVLGSQTHGVTPVQLANAFRFPRRRVPSRALLHQSHAGGRLHLSGPRAGQLCRAGRQPADGLYHEPAAAGRAHRAGRHRPGHGARRGDGSRRQNGHYDGLPRLHLCGPDALLRHGGLVGLRRPGRPVPAGRAHGQTAADALAGLYAAGTGRAALSGISRAGGRRCTPLRPRHRMPCPLGRRCGILHRGQPAAGAARPAIAPCPAP